MNIEPMRIPDQFLCSDKEKVLDGTCEVVAKHIQRGCIFMIAGRLVVKKDYYCAILELKHEDGRRLQKTCKLEIPIKGKKEQDAAEIKLLELRKEYTQLQFLQQNRAEVRFDLFLNNWLASKKKKVSPTTYKSYKHIIDKYICPYFGKMRLVDIDYSIIEDYYELLETINLSSTTIYHHHSIVRQIFKTALKKKMLSDNPMELVSRPKRQKPVIGYYSINEVSDLFDSAKGHKLEILIHLAVFYGFRRSEVLGLKWSDIDYNAKTITITRTVVEAADDDGKRIIVVKSDMKNAQSRRTMPLSETIINMLKKEWIVKEQFRSPYICTDKRGELIKPDEVTNAFTKILKSSGLRHIRFHDLRHTTASLMISARVPLIEVQQWLGHSTIATTADMYAHLDYSAKISNANLLEKMIGQKSNKGDHLNESAESIVNVIKLHGHDRVCETITKILGEATERRRSVYYTENTLPDDRRYASMVEAIQQRALQYRGWRKWVIAVFIFLLGKLC